MARYAFGTARGPAGCHCMEPPTQYQRFAAESRRLAQQAKTKQQQRILEEMARTWEKLAKETDLEDGLQRTLRTDTALRCQDRQRGHGRRLPAPAPDVELSTATSSGVR